MAARRNVLLGMLAGATDPLSVAGTSAASLSLGGGPKEPPECLQQTECRFSVQGASRTLLAWGAPVFSRDGHVLSNPKDPNITTYTWACSTCGKSWQEKD